MDDIGDARMMAEAHGLSVVRSAHDVTRAFERALADYTGAPHVVCVNSCTMALLLAVAWHVTTDRRYERLTVFDVDGRKKETGTCIEIPKRTYVGVPMSIIHAGGWPAFRDEDWIGSYQLEPLPVFDSARHLYEGMYVDMADQDSGPWCGLMMCLSFHATKTLGIEQGGAILLDNPEADAWLRRMRFDGRTAGVPVAQDNIREIGYHCYMNPSTAAQGLMRMAGLPEHNDPIPWDDYPDLSQMECFK